MDIDLYMELTGTLKTSTGAQGSPYAEVEIKKRSIDENKQYFLSNGKPSYWPTDRNKTPDLLDFFVYKGL